MALDNLNMLEKALNLSRPSVLDGLATLKSSFGIGEAASALSNLQVGSGIPSTAAGILGAAARLNEDVRRAEAQVEEKSKALADALAKTKKTQADLEAEKRATEELQAALGGLQ